WGFAARIYLEEGRWADAANAAINARAGLSLDAPGYTSNYTGGISDEVMWQFPQTIVGNGQSLFFGTPSSFFEQTGEGYDAFWISEEFANSFSLTDVRNTFYIYGTDPSGPDFIATNKFGTEAKAQDTIELLNGNVVPLRGVDFAESLNMMRVGEMYLIEAEAKARLGAGDAADVLYELQLNRDPDAVKSGNTGQLLIDEILLERRKELYGELGIDWLDAKRLQNPIDRTTSNHPAPNNFIIPANDPSFNYKIPQTEIQANPNIGPDDQNP
ncbi:MAG: RagB/SusD family nutrient uptake outer membrane protein, partial [Flavitalea sp.]